MKFALDNQGITDKRYKKADEWSIKKASKKRLL